MNIRIVSVDYPSSKHADDLLRLMEVYASDIMGGGTPLSENVKTNLVSALSELEGAFSLLAYLDEEPIGLANCFMSFSTFKCKPVVNIHDLVVIEKYRGRGISFLLLEKIEEIAIQRKCCKITLEVLEGNIPAQKAYRKFGFGGYELNPATGHALFWQKKI